LDQSTLSVADVMTHDVATVGWNEKLLVADDVMRLGRIRHLPALNEDGELVGILTQRDLFHSGVIKALGYGTNATRKALDMLVVKEAMTSAVLTTTPETPLREAAELMLSRKIGCLPVLQAGKLVGILTESDFVALVARPGPK
jgi:CBS domain-containing protein